MDYDVSFHPVDLGLIHDRVLPFIQGRRDLDDLVPDAVRIARNQFRARAWVEGLLEFLEGEAAADFNGGLDVRGRPFFITCGTPEEVSGAIDRYLAADRSGVDDLAREMLRDLDASLPPKVRPSENGELPSKREMAEELISPLEEVRDAYAGAMRTRRRWLFKHRPHASRFVRAALAFASVFRPGWSARGQVWPSRLLREAGNSRVPFEPARAIVEPLFAECPTLTDDLADTIAEHFSVGGYIVANQVGVLQAELGASDAKLRGAAKGLGDSRSVEADLRKIREALYDARRHNLPFVEATDIDFGPGGRS